MVEVALPSRASVHASIRRVSCAAVLTLALVACGEQLVAPRDRLSESDARDAFSALMKVEGFAYGFVDDRPLRSATPRPAAFVLPVNQTVNCPAGGWTQILGEVTGNEFTGEVGMTYAQSLGNCAARSDRRLWTFTGERALQTGFIATYDSVSRTANVTGTIGGRLRVIADGFDAVCDLRMEITVVQDAGSFRGAMCGVPIVMPYRPPA
jgi:hypothetical protein